MVFSNFLSSFFVCLFFWFYIFKYLYLYQNQRYPRGILLRDKLKSDANSPKRISLFSTQHKYVIHKLKSKIILNFFCDVKGDHFYYLLGLIRLVQYWDGKWTALTNPSFWDSGKLTFNFWQLALKSYILWQNLLVYLR